MVMMGKAQMTMFQDQEFLPKGLLKKIHSIQVDLTSASRLLVPDSIKKLKVNQAWIDLPADHQGRLRTFEHERGNWATFAYINYEGHEGIRHLLESIITSVPVVSLNEVDDFHISLTKTVILKHHWIFPFVNSMKEKIIHHKRFVAAFGDLKVYCNEEKSRTFIGLEIVNGYNRLLSLVKDFDNCLAEFQLPQFYDDPSFHMSILWCVGDMETKLNEYLPLLNKRLHDIMEDYINENWCILANCIYWTTFMLSGRHDAERVQRRHFIQIANSRIVNFAEKPQSKRHLLLKNDRHLEKRHVKGNAHTSHLTI